MFPVLLLLSSVLLVQPDWSYYHTSSQIHDLTHDIVSRNNIVAGQVWMKERWGKNPDDEQKDTDINIVDISNPHANPTQSLSYAVPPSPLLTFLTSSSSSSSPSPLPLRALLNFGEHGRELISSEIALQLLHYFDINKHATAEEEEQDASSSSPSPSPPPPVSPLFLSFLLSHFSLRVIPLLNVWSHVRIESGHLCERKNHRSVDLNRNWDYLWSSGPRREERDDQFPGNQPFSEVESRVLRNEASQLRPDLYINYHSGIREMYCGWDHKTELIPNHLEVMRLLRYVGDQHCRCAIGGAGAIGGYVVYGGSMDYLYDTLGCTYSLTVEVYGGLPGISPQDCFAYFNPTTKEILGETTRDWTRLTIEAINFLVQEKSGIAFPYRKEAWMRKRSGSEKFNEADLLANEQEAEESNRYHTMREWSRKLDASMRGTQDLLRREEGFGWIHSNNRNGSALELIQQLTEGLAQQKDACASFVSDLPQRSREELEEINRKRPILSLYSVNTSTAPAGSSFSSSIAASALSPPPLIVLVVAGALWNDLLSTELLCSWMQRASLFSSSSSSASGPDSSSSPPATPLKLWFVPSLFGSSRSTLLESPLLHPSFCSTLLSPDSKIRLITQQIASNAALINLMQHTIKPHVVLEIAAEKYISEQQRSEEEEEGEESKREKEEEAASSFMHLEITSLAVEAATEGTESDSNINTTETESSSSTTPSREFFHSLSHIFSSSSIPLSSSTLSQSVRSLSAAHVDRDRSSSSSSSVCSLGIIPVESLLLDGLCPSCVALLKLYVHGRSDASAAAASAASTDAAKEGEEAPPQAHDPFSAEHIERKNIQQQKEEWDSRTQTDRKPPAAYTTASANDAPLDPNLTKMERRSIALLPSPSRSSSVSCDYSLRNLPAHHQSRVLSLHVSHSLAVIDEIVSALNNLARVPERHIVSTMRRNQPGAEGGEEEETEENDKTSIFDTRNSVPDAAVHPISLPTSTEMMSSESYFDIYYFLLLLVSICVVGAVIGWKVWRKKTAANNNKPQLMMPLPA